MLLSSGFKNVFFLFNLSTERQVFLATWKDIPNDNESQFQIKDCHLGSGKDDQRTECIS